MVGLLVVAAILSIAGFRDETQFGLDALTALSVVIAVVVAVWRFDPTAKTDRFKEDRYAVYLTFPANRSQTNPSVEVVDLGEAAPINDAVELICKRMSANPPQYRARDLSPAFQRLSDLVYAPLARHLTNVSHLIVCPDGQLSRLPFELLPVGNKFLVEEKTISYVTSGREIVRIASPKSSVHSSKSLVMGNPDFNLDLNVAQASQPAGSAGILARSYGNAKQDACATFVGCYEIIEPFVSRNDIHAAPGFGRGGDERGKIARQRCRSTARSGGA
jgi:hypothetical protein